MYRARGRPRCLGWVNRVDFAMSAIRPTESTGHAWLHSRCWTIWHVGRNIEAATFLAAMGIAQMPHSTLQISIAGTSPAARGKTGIRASPTGASTAAIDSVEVEAFADLAAGSNNAASGSMLPEVELDWPLQGVGHRERHLRERAGDCAWTWPRRVSPTTAPRRTV